MCVCVSVSQHHYDRNEQKRKERKKKIYKKRKKLIKVSRKKNEKQRKKERKKVNGRIKCRKIKLNNFSRISMKLTKTHQTERMEKELNGENVEKNEKWKKQ